MGWVLQRSGGEVGQNLQTRSLSPRKLWTQWEGRVKIFSDYRKSETYLIYTFSLKVIRQLKQNSINQEPRKRKTWESGNCGSKMRNNNVLFQNFYKHRSPGSNLSRSRWKDGCTKKRTIGRLWRVIETLGKLWDLLKTMVQFVSWEWI